MVPWIDADRVGTEPRGAISGPALLRLAGVEPAEGWVWTAPHAPDGCPDLGIPSCLRCPLPRCRYDTSPGRARAALAAERLVVLVYAGVTLRDAARRLGVSRRTVYRYWASVRALRAEGRGR